MNYIINVSKSIAAFAFATVFVALGTTVVFPATVQAITYSTPSSCCKSSTTYSTPQKTSTSYSTPSYSSTSYSTPSKSSTSYSTPSYSSTSYSTPSQSSTSYSTPSYSSTSYSTPSKSSTSYSTPSYSSTSYSTPSYGSTSYSTPSYTTGSYSTPSYTTGSYSTPSYTTGSYSTPSYTVADYSTPSYSYSTPSYTTSSYSTPSYSYSTPSYSYDNGSYSSSSTYYNTSYENPVVYQPVCQIYANPSSVAYNGSTTITWNSSYATSASLSEVGTVAVNGSYTVHNVTSPRTFTLTVSGQGGTNTCVTYIYVQQQQTPVCQITANPNSVQSGGSTTISWTSTNATSATLSGLGNVAVNGSYVVNNLTSTRTFTLTVTGQGGTNTCVTTVGVYDYQQNAPYCTLTINPSVINNSNYNYNYNNSAVISWTTTNATSASIDGIGNVSIGSGSQTIYPGTTRTYTMTVYGQNGQTRTCTGHVTVQNQQNGLYCSITANPNTISNGSGSVLTWTSTGATSASLSDGLGNVAINGSLTVYPEANRNYVLTVRNYSGQTQTCTTNVNVNGSYISLTQIPYTGFDLGVIGNTIYWMVLAGGAAAAAYAMTMYRGGILNLAFAGARKEQAIAKAVITEDEEKEDSIADEAVETVSAGDAMTLEIVNGMPRLTINRSRGTEGLPGQNN